MKIWGSCCCVVLFMALGVPALAAPAEKPKPGVETEKPSKLVVRHEGRDVVANVEDILLMSDDVGWRLADGAETLLQNEIVPDPGEGETSRNRDISISCRRSRISRLPLGSHMRLVSASCSTRTGPVSM